jgi:hypothetical protein
VLRINRRTGLLFGLAAFVVLGVGLGAFLVLAGTNNNQSEVASDTSISTATSGTVPETSVPPVPYRGIELSSILSSCAATEITGDQQNRILVVSADSGALLQQQLTVGDNQIATFRCADDIGIVTFAFGAEGLSVLDSRQWEAGEITWFSETVGRVGIVGECCFPDVPYKEAYVVEVLDSGMLVLSYDDLSRYDKWNPVSKNCDASTRPDRYPAIYSNGDGKNYSEKPLYITVCSKGRYVTELQQMLIKSGYDLDADGLFGPATLESLRTLGGEDGFYYAIDGVFASDWRYAIGGRGLSPD